MNLKDLKIPMNNAWPLVLGVDMGSRSLKYVLLRRKGRSLRIEAFGKHTFENGGMEPYEAMQQAVELLFRKKSDFRRAKTVIGLGGSKVLIKTESFPKLKKSELRQTIFFALERELGTDGADSHFIFDYKTLSPDPDQTGNIQYLTMGVSEETVDDKVNFFISEGVVPAKVTPTMVTISNLVEYIPEIKDKESVGILDIGAQSSTLVFLKNGKLSFHREIVVGGDDFTRGITGTIFHEGRAIQFKTEEALEFKLKFGYPVGFSEGMTFMGAPLSEVGMMMRPVVERLTGEIQRSIGFYKEKSGGQSVESLYLLGGGASLRHLPEVLAEKLDIPVHPLPKLEGLRVEGKQEQQDAFDRKYMEQAVSLSLALESSAEGNLLPSSYKKINQTAFLQRSLQFAAAGVVALLALLTLFYRGRADSLRGQVKSMEVIVARSRNSGPVYTSLLNEKSMLEGKIAGLQTFSNQDETPIQVLRLFSHATPKSLSLIYLEFGKEEEKKNKSAKAGTSEIAPKKIVKVRGVSHRPPNDVRVHVAKLIDELEKSGYFSDVKFDKDIYDEENKEYGFELIGYLKEKEEKTGE